MRSIHGAIAACVLLAGTGPVCAAEAKKTSAVAPSIVYNKGGARFTPLSEREQDLTRPKLGNGTVANTAFWPASFVAEVGAWVCTATLIGPEVLLTARHCVDDGATASITFADGTLVEGPCAHPSAGGNDLSADWTLCRMKPAVQRPGMYYERISVDASKIKNKLRLTAAGYGCQDLQTKKIEQPPAFRIGPVYVETPASPGSAWPNWITTYSAAGGASAFLCQGDSGGGVYLEQPDGNRLIVAVNSAVGDKPQYPDYQVSYLSALHTQAAVDFLTEWVKKNKGVGICGWGGQQPSNCRPPQP